MKFAKNDWKSGKSGTTPLSWHPAVIMFRFRKSGRGGNILIDDNGFNYYIIYENVGFLNIIFYGYENGGYENVGYEKCRVMKM